MADRIVVLRGGYIEQVGKSLDLYNHPANKFVAGFIGAPQMNVLRGCLDEGTLSLECSLVRDVPVAGGGQQQITLGLRPKAIGVTFHTECFHIFSEDERMLGRAMT